MRGRDWSGPDVSHGHARRTHVCRGSSSCGMFSLASWLLFKRELKQLTDSRVLVGLCSQGTFQKKRAVFVVTARGT